MPANVPTETAPPNAEPVSPPAARSLSDLPLSGRLRFLLFGRTVPAVLFGSLAWFQIVKLRNHMSEFGANGTLLQGSVITHDILYLLFCAIPVGIYLTRAMPRASDGSLPARAAAFVGTTMLLFIPIVIKDAHKVWSSETFTLWVGMPILIVSSGFAVVATLYLRRNLSIMPEARALVTGGPYSIVRHPLYLAEIGAAVGFVVGNATATQLVSIVALIALQMTRTVYEERLLTSTFPAYSGYAARTRKIVPGIW